MFIDFGAGFYVEKHLKRYQKLDPNEIVIGIDATTEIPERFSEFLQIMDDYYIKEKDTYIKKKETPFKYFDKYFFGTGIQDELKLESKADHWICISTLEHVREQDIFSVMEGIVNKVKETSVGSILIDLTDHLKYPPDEKNCFYHYKDPLYRSEWNPTNVATWNNGHRGIFLNRVRREEWFIILDQFFTYDLGPTDGVTTIDILNVKIKKC